MITVCVASFNGANYIGAQLESILASSLVTEVIVSDDGSLDNTATIIDSFEDPRLRLVAGPKEGIVSNFEFLLSLASGDYIFLSDQDDIWLPDKVEVMLLRLQEADLVVCNCAVVDKELTVLHRSFFDLRDSGPGFVKNIYKNSYLGCCLAFRKSLLRHALPFPARLPMHDWWLGLIAEAFGRTAFVSTPLTLYRRHGANASATSEVSRVPWLKQVRWRATLLRCLILRRLEIFWASFVWRP